MGGGGQWRILVGNGQWVVGGEWQNYGCGDGVFHKHASSTTLSLSRMCVAMTVSIQKLAMLNPVQPGCSLLPS